jgi:hypothetical protein
MQTGLKCIIGQLRPRADLRRYPWERVESYEKKMDAGEAEGTKLLTDGLVAGKALQHAKRDGCFVTPTLANRER